MPSRNSLAGEHAHPGAAAPGLFLRAVVLAGVGVIPDPRSTRRAARLTLTGLWLSEAHSAEAAPLQRRYGCPVLAIARLYHRHPDYPHDWRDLSGLRSAEDFAGVLSVVGDRVRASGS